MTDEEPKIPENTEYLEMMTKLLTNSTFNLIEDVKKLKKELEDLNTHIIVLERRYQELVK